MAREAPRARDRVADRIADRPAASRGAVGARRPPLTTKERRSDAPLWQRTSPRIIVATLLAALVPVALAGQILGVWRLTLPGIGAPFAPAPSYTPRDLFVAVDVSVLPQPASGDPIARLGAGFPVRTVEQQTVDTSTWLRITWAGPSHASGGTGWVRETDLVSYAAHARPVGDLGALAPSLRAAAGQRHITAALYFPNTGQLYLSATADQPFPLDGGVRAVLLAALYANAASHGQPPPAAIPGSPAALVASGDAAATASVYAQLGDATGVGAYLTRLGVSGIALAPGQPTAATATPRAMLTFYAALLTTNTFSDADRATILGLLAQSETTPLASSGLVGSGGALVTGAGNASGGWTVSASGLLAPQQGSRVIVAAIATADSASAGRSALAAWYAQLGATLIS
jgi:hypothetical protein